MFAERIVSLSAVGVHTHFSNGTYFCYHSDILSQPSFSLKYFYTLSPNKNDT